MRIGSVVLAVWFVIGLLAAVQRDYFNAENPNCRKTGTVVVTILDGPLNYLGVNPKVKNCDLPEPSR